MILQTLELTNTIVFGDFTAGGKGAAEGCDVLDVSPELDLLGKEMVASLAIFRALIGEVRFVFAASSAAGMRMVLSPIRYSFVTLIREFTLII